MASSQKRKAFDLNEEIGKRIEITDEEGMDSDEERNDEIANDFDEEDEDTIDASETDDTSDEEFVEKSNSDKERHDNDSYEMINKVSKRDSRSEEFNNGGYKDDEDDEEEEEEEDEEEEEYQGDEEIMENDVVPTTDVVINVSELRLKLGSPEGASAIKSYFSQKGDLDYVREYIKQGGSVGELLSQLEQMDIRKGLAVDVFSALGLIILKTMKEFPDHEYKLTEDCKEFITKYITQMSPMLSSKMSLGRKKTVLKLLTAIASINDALALQVLSGLDLKRDVIYYLAEHNNPMDESSIRILFAQFLLSFIVGHNAKVINRLCEKKYWIPALFPEMKYDLFKTVDLILTALEEWLINRKDVTKSAKLYVFNSKTLSHLANLYQWNPKSWRENVKDKKITIPPTDPEELSLVRAKVHHLLLTLCTSVKFGVIFNDPKYGTSQHKVNSLVQQFLTNFSQPWEDILKNELVSKTLLACPDLIKPFCNSIASFLKLPTSTKWITAMQFITNIIEGIEVTPKFLENKAWLKIIYSVFAPDILLEVITKERLLTGTAETKITCLSTFSVIVKKIGTIYSYITKTVIKNIFHANLSQYLIKTAPNADVLFGCLKISLGEGNYNSTKITIDLIFSLHSVFPQLFDTIRYNKLVLQMLQENKEAIKQQELDQDRCNLVLKLIKLEIMLNPQAESKDAYVKYLEDIFQLAYANGEDCKNLAIELIKEILESTGLFINTPFELTLWVHLLSEITPEIGTFLREALLFANEQRYEICNAIFLSQEGTLENMEAGQISLDDFINLSVNEEYENPVDTTENKANEVISYNSNLELSPLLPALLNVVSKSTSNKLGYNLLTRFMIHFLHTQVSTKAYSSLLAKYTCYAVDKVLNYVSTWNSKPKALSLSPFTDSIYSHISKYILLKSDEEPLDKINLNDKVMVELCLNQCTFTICQLSLIGQAFDEIIIRSINIVKYLIKATTKLPLTHPQLLNDFHPVRICSSNLTSFVTAIVENSSEIPYSTIYPYANRFFFELKYAKHKKYRLEHCNNLKQFLINFPLSKDHIVKLTELIFSMKPKYFYLNNELTPWICVIEYLLNKAAEFEIIIPVEFLSKLCEIIYELDKADFELTNLNKELYNYIVKSKIEISGMLFDKFSELFLSLCTNKYWYEEFCVLLMQIFGQELPELPQHISIDRAIILIASVNFEKNYFKHILSSRYSEILVAICTQPTPSWLADLAKVIQPIMSNKTCDKLCKDINKLSDQVNITKDSLLLIKEVFYKSRQNPLFLHLLNYWLTESSQKSDHSQSTEICRTFLSITSTEEDLSYLQKLDSNLIEYLILYGMKLPSAALLDYLKFYVAISQLTSPPNHILDLIWSHTYFINIFVGTTSIKISLLLLIMELFKMDTSLIKESYIPVFLSAYQASLTESDKIILEVLQLFESCGINMSICKPYVWGESAIEHYAIKQGSKPSKSHPTFTLDHLNRDMINRTITHFPINRKLEGSCTVEYEDVYDPAFILPVLHQVLSPDSTVNINPWKVFHCGAMALTLASLGSKCSEIRAAACLVIQKIHAQNNRKKDALVWYHFIEAIRQGLAEFDESNEVPKVSCLVSTFLARASLIIFDPTHYLYKQIQNFIYARPAMNLKTVPALMEVFHSTEEHYRLHQQWMLEVIRDGIKESSDLQLAFKCNVLKMLLVFHSSCLSNKDIKVLIEEIVAKCLKYADKENHFLINNYSVIPWLEYSGKSSFLLEQLPQKSTSQIKSLVTYVCRSVKKNELDGSNKETEKQSYVHETLSKSRILV
ncbi:nucleolar pre-ribosomal-associated protein 1 isoform X2 [Rhodnius prolixus]